MSKPDITLYTAQTPNGIKISIALEELGYAIPSNLTHSYQVLTGIASPTKSKKSTSAKIPKKNRGSSP